MKKLFLLLALMGLVAIGCTKDEIEDKNDNNQTEQPDENEGGNEDDSPEIIFFALDKESVTISPDGGSVGVVVYSNYKWEISGASDWCTPSVKTGDANEDGQQVTFSADVAYDDREATFWFRCADEKIKLVVSQKLKEVIIPDANNSFYIPAEGGIAVISYKTTVDCEVIIPEEARDWITIAPATRGLLSENINLDILENTTYSARTAVIRVVAKDNAELVVEYTVNQEQNNAILTDENDTFIVPSEGGEVVINYQTNVDCEIVIPEEAQDWISVAPATRGLVAFDTTLKVAANNSGKERRSVVKVVSRENNSLFAEYTISQDLRYCLCYTSIDGEIVTPYSSSAFDAVILSNTYKDGVGVIEFDAPITTVGDYAFRGCSSLKSVIIGDSVTTIGDYAFEGCSNLTNVTIPDTVTAIGWNAFGFSGLISVTIPVSVTSIGGCAFIGCSELTSVTIPDSVTMIEWGTFLDCYSLTNVTIPDSITTIGGSAFEGCSSLTSITIPDSVTTIGESAFWGCSSLTSITIPDSVTTVGYYAFRGCSSLKSVIIGDSITTIEESAFEGCSSLTSIIIPDSVTTIGESAFWGCDRLTNVTIPDSVTEIAYSAFGNCTSLKSVYISDIAAWCNISFGDHPLYYAGNEGNLYLNNELVTNLTIPDNVTAIGEYAFQNCSSLTSVTIPDSVTTVGMMAFWYCSSLASLTIGNSVTTIGGGAFFGCGRLTNVTIPDSVTSIENIAFWCCNKLTSVTIGDGVTTIGEGAFRSCNSLTSVYCKPTIPPAGDREMFNGNASDCKIYVPMESVSEYKSASYWSDYADVIVGYEF